MKKLNIFEALTVSQFSNNINKIFELYNEGCFRAIFKDKTVDEVFYMISYKGEVDNSELKYKDVPINFEIKNKTTNRVGVVHKLNEELYQIYYSYQDELCSELILTSELIEKIKNKEYSVIKVKF